MPSDAETEGRFDDLAGKVTVLSEEVGKVGPELESLSRQTADLRAETRGLRQSLAEESRALRQGLAGESRALRQEIQAVRHDLGEDINALRHEVAEEFKAVRQEHRDDMQTLRPELAGFRSDFSAFQRQALGLAVTLIGVLIAGVITLVIALQ